jgi:hypothetical protein
MDGITYEYSAANSEPSHQYLYPSVSRFLKDIPPGSVVMDAGCGNGSFIALFQDRKWSLHGSDLSPTGIAVARKTFPNIDFFLADGQTLYADFLATVGPVDVVLSTEVIEHIYDPMGFLRNCYELLKPGGTIVLTTPYHGYLKTSCSPSPVRWTSTSPYCGIMATSSSGPARPSVRLSKPLASPTSSSPDQAVSHTSGRAWSSKRRSPSNSTRSPAVLPLVQSLTNNFSYVCYDQPILQT